MTVKERVDVVLAQRGLCPTREQAQRLILAGEVWSGDHRIEKPGTRIALTLPLELRIRTPQYVSRGGLKLAHALTAFKVNASARVCLDIGASTGGFTDCLLQQGARRVFAVDVGYGQLDRKLRTHPQVSVLEKTNARYLTLDQLIQKHPEARQIDLVCIDASFISLGLLLAPLKKVVLPSADWIFLFKPQFEVGPENLGKGGTVRKPEAVKTALEEFENKAKQLGFCPRATQILSPIAGKKSGNEEFLLHYGCT